MAKLSPQVVDALKEKIDAATGNPDGIPGLVMIAIDRNGDYIFEHASGTIGAGIGKPMTLDTVFWIASCTKIIVTIAAMQLVEQGKLALDDVDLVETLAPELKDVKVLEEDPSGESRLVEKIGGITLRMLLTHTGMAPLSLGKVSRDPF
jgi:CubicO group peptidase (beta-lactamase class C family)